MVLRAFNLFCLIAMVTSAPTTQPQDGEDNEPWTDLNSWDAAVDTLLTRVRLPVELNRLAKIGLLKNKLFHRNSESRMSSSRNHNIDEDVPQDNASTDVCAAHAKDFHKRQLHAYVLQISVEAIIQRLEIEVGQLIHKRGQISELKSDKSAVVLMQDMIAVQTLLEKLKPGLRSKFLMPMQRKRLTNLANQISATLATHPLSIWQNHRRQHQNHTSRGMKMISRPKVYTCHHDAMPTASIPQDVEERGEGDVDTEQDEICSQPLDAHGRRELQLGELMKDMKADLQLVYYACSSTFWEWLEDVISGMPDEEIIRWIEIFYWIACNVHVVDTGICVDGEYYPWPSFPGVGLPCCPWG